MTFNESRVVQEVIETYLSLDSRPPSGVYTVLAAIVLTYRTQIKIIGLATGSKCLPKDCLPKQGDALHDCHAEVLARRCALRWVFEEIQRSARSSTPSEWLTRQNTDGIIQLKEGVGVVMYISTPPCEVLLPLLLCLHSELRLRWGCIYGFHSSLSR